MGLRGCSVNDYNSGTAKDVDVALAGILPTVALRGDIWESGSGTLQNRTEKYLEFLVVTKPATVLANANANLQDYGYIWRLTYTVLPCKYLWIKYLRKVGSDPTAGVIPRARLDIATGLTDDSLYTSELTFPMAVVLDGEARPSAKFETGTTDLEFKLCKNTPG
jgi:hypothetical protein